MNESGSTEPSGETQGPSVPHDRITAISSILAALRVAERIVLATHINPDGDGLGSEVAMAHYLRRRGVRVSIVNVGGLPAAYEFMRDDLTFHSASDAAGHAAVDAADLILVVDTSEPSRLGSLAARLRGKSIAVIDHHPPMPGAIGSPALIDPSACATGELVFDLLEVEGGEVSPEQAEALYAAIVTDTGSFRFSNTTPRAHEVAAALIRAGADPSRMYHHLFAQLTSERLELVKRALASLRTDPDVPVAWVTLSHSDIVASGAPADDMEGIVDYARRLRGIEVAILLRELGDGRTKVSLRSNGDVNVAATAREFGGGGHDKAAGALIAQGLEEAEADVVAAVKRAVIRGTRA